MKLKTTLCAVLLSLTSVSMIACSNGESSNGTSAVTTVDNSLEAQLKTVDTEIAALEEQKTAIQADLLTSPEFMAELTENFDVAEKAFQKNAWNFDLMIHKGHVFENGDEIKKNHGILMAERDEAKLALDEAKAVSKDAASDIKIIDIKIASKNVDKTIIVKKIDVEALQAGQKTMTDKNDRDNNEMLINRKLKEIEQLMVDKKDKDGVYEY